jgi:formate dehydrogenase major subunit
VQDIFLTETARLADVIFPALAWAEKDGTFTNLERRIQRVRKSVNKSAQSEGMEDWKIISEISGNMAVKMRYLNAEEVFAEVGKVSPLYRDLTYEEIEKGGAIYPYKGEPLRGATAEITVGKGEGKKAADKIHLGLERPLFHSGTLSRKAPALVDISSEAVAKISPAVAKSLSLNDGDAVRISTRAGFLSVPSAIDMTLEGFSVMLTNNFEGQGAFSLLDYTIDPVTKAPVIEGIDVRVEKG